MIDTIEIEINLYKNENSGEASESKKYNSKIIYKYHAHIAHNCSFLCCTE